jgi:hypothetical protein
MEAEVRAVIVTFVSGAALAAASLQAASLPPGPSARRETDSPLEGDGFELAVPPSAKGKAIGSHSKQALPFRT